MAVEIRFTDVMERGGLRGYVQEFDAHVDVEILWGDGRDADGKTFEVTIREVGVRKDA